MANSSIKNSSWDSRVVQRMGREEVEGQGLAQNSDNLAVEEPLEIRLNYCDQKSDQENGEGERTIKPISITMRTPGLDGQEDVDLALGFLVTEGIITDPNQVISCQYNPMFCGEDKNRENQIDVELASDYFPETGKLQRHFYTSSSCGVCGKASLQAVEEGLNIQALSFDINTDRQIDQNDLNGLPQLLRTAQLTFSETGGLHAAGLFSIPDSDSNPNSTPELLLLREDVGRHNAVDKVVGASFMQNQLPLKNTVLLVSGRASFELVQKALVAGIPTLAAVGAPSTLAVDLANKFGMTLIGFLRRGRFNIYSGLNRVKSTT
ncbi:MAG: FdhD protein [Limisphaerales bacterium]|jgi:FdhD protein